MAGKKIDVLYQGPGDVAWRRVGSVHEKVRTPREVAKILLAEADVAAASLRKPREARARARALSEEEIFERDMAAAMGAWNRYVEVEAKILWRGAEHAFVTLAEAFRRSHRRDE